MPAAWTEGWRGVLAAVVPSLRSPREADGAQGGSDEPDNPDPTSAPRDPSYNALVRAAMEDGGRTERMDRLDIHRTDDRIRLLRAESDEQLRSLKTAIVYCTGSVVVVLGSLTALLAVAGAFGLTSPAVAAPLVAAAMSLVTGLGFRMGRLVSQYTSVARPTARFSEDRRAVVPDERPGDRA